MLSAIRWITFDVSIWLLVLLLLTPGHSAELNPSNHFRTLSKNILFSSTFGGSSHNNWVLRILDELHERGHNVAHATTVSSISICIYYSAVLTLNRKITLDSVHNVHMWSSFLLDHLILRIDVEEEASWLYQCHLIWSSTTKPTWSKITTKVSTYQQ